MASGKKRKNCLKMEILKTGGKPDRILMKNVVYEIDDLRQRCIYEESCPSILFYKQSPSGEELFDLPTLRVECETRELLLFPNKIICDVVINKDFKIESIVCKSVWKDKKQPIPFNDWLEKTKEKLQTIKKLEEKIKPLYHEINELRNQKCDIEHELRKFEFTERYLHH